MTQITLQLLQAPVLYTVQCARNSGTVTLLYTGLAAPPPSPADPDPTSSGMGPYTLVDLAMSALQKHATDTLALSRLRFATTRCSTLLNLPLLTSCKRSPTFTSSAPGTTGTSTHPSPPASRTCRPPASGASSCASRRSTVRKLGSEWALHPMVSSGSGQGG
nr:unnamed protein product [Digitaria exilis]